MRDPGKVMQDHYNLQKERCIGIPSKMRKYSGCSRRKSVGQFNGASENCLQCVRRAPRVPS